MDNLNFALWRFLKFISWTWILPRSGSMWTFSGSLIQIQIRIKTYADPKHWKKQWKNVEQLTTFKSTKYFIMPESCSVCQLFVIKVKVCLASWIRILYDSQYEYKIRIQRGRHSNFCQFFSVVYTLWLYRVQLYVYSNSTESRILY